jgi:hypothetical protein
LGNTLLTSEEPWIFENLPTNKNPINWVKQIENVFMNGRKNTWESYLNNI